MSRRYKHYDWLHERLCIKFAFFSVPPLPDKQYYGKSEGEREREGGGRRGEGEKRIKRDNFLSL